MFSVQGMMRRAGRTALAVPALAAIGIAATLAGCGGSTAIIKPAPDPAPVSRIAEEQPPHPAHLDVATAAQEAAARHKAAVATARRKAAAAAKKEREAQEAATESGAPPPPGSLPPASAGTNGSYTPPPPSQRKKITPRVIEQFEQQEAEGRAVLLSGIALAPPDAPGTVKAVINAANTIVGRPYIWGGGHASWYSAATTARARSASRSAAAASSSPLASARSSAGAPPVPASGSPSTPTPATPTP